MADRLNGYGMMGVEPDGEFVRYSDFARLEAENRELRAKLETVRDETLPATGPYVDRIIRVFRDRTDDDTSAAVLTDYAKAALRSLKDKDQQNG